MRIWFKMAAVAGIALVILVPLGLVRGVIGERQAYRQQAVADVVRSYAGPQVLTGPVLSVPYTDTVEVEETDRNGTVRRVQRRRTAYWTFFPADLGVSGPLQPTVRRRGIHEVRLYAWRGRVDARFEAMLPADAPAGAARVIGRPVLSFGIADVRGIRGTPRLAVGGRLLEPREGHGAREQPGLHVLLDMPAPGGSLAFATRLDIELAGAESFAVVPLGKRNRIDLASSWPHPSFQGMSPWRSEVGGNGFRAHWQLASVATDVQRQYQAGRTAPALHASQRMPEAIGGGALDALGVVLGDPVDAYTRADRAAKYGVLFVVLTFVGFFMFELLRQVRIHPIQYGLVGLALAIFFLLLVSLGEHIRFGIAYLVASIACIGLIGFYLAAMLRSRAWAAAFSGMLGLLYAALYGLLISEDNALVLGSLLLFAVLGAIMAITRRVDWYRLADEPAEALR